MKLSSLTWLYALVALSLSNVSYARIYKHTDSTGNVTFSDTPAPGESADPDDDAATPPAAVTPPAKTQTPSNDSGTQAKPAPDGAAPTTSSQTSADTPQNTPSNPGRGLGFNPNLPSTQAPDATPNKTLPTPAGSSPLEANPAQTSPQPQIKPQAPAATPTSTSSSSDTEQASAKKDYSNYYKEFFITAPQDQTTFTQEQETIDVTYQLTPPVQSMHNIETYLDGNSIEGYSHAAVIKLPRQDRGAHQIQLRVVDENQNVLINTAPVTFNQIRLMVRKKV